VCVGVREQWKCSDVGLSRCACVYVKGHNIDIPAQLKSSALVWCGTQGEKCSLI